MKYKLALTFIILSLLGLSLFYGCGGGNDGITTPSSISNGEENNITTENYGYITIQVIWPQGEVSDICSLTIEDEDNTITASMPANAQRVEIKVFDQEDVTEDTPLSEVEAGVEEERFAPLNQPVTDDIIPMVPGTSFVYHIVKPIPAIPVTIFAYIYDATEGGELIGTPARKELNVSVGNNTLELQTGEEQLSLSATPSFITLSPDIASSMAAEETPIPELSGETLLVARLVLESDDIPDQSTPTPLPTITAGENGDIESQGEWGLEGYEVKFTIIDGIGKLIPVGGTAPDDVVTSNTSEYGYAGAILRTDTAGKIEVQASCQLDPDDPESIITATCEVGAVTSTSVEDSIYQMKLTPGNGSIFHTDFSSPDIPDNWARSADISAVLEKINFTTGSPEPAPNMEISWSMTGGYGSLSAPLTTDGNGISTATLDVSGEPIPSYADGYEKIVTLKAEFTHPYKENNTIVKEAPIYINSKTAMADGFERYELDTKAYDLYVWWSKWIASGSAGSQSPDREESKIVSPGAFGTGQAIKLYTSSASGYARIERQMGYWYVNNQDVPIISTELRFCVKIDNGSLTMANIDFRGIKLEDAGNYLPLMTLNNETGLILDSNGEEIMPCTPDTWYSVRVQLLADRTNPLEKVKVNYWLETSMMPGEFKKETVIRNLSLFSTNEKILVFEAYGGTVWFDELDEIPLPNIDVP